MSIKFLTYAFDARVNNPLRKLVLLKLCDNANDDGECWPSFGTIAAQCEMSRRSAINHVNALIEDGFLVASPRFKSGEQTSNMYTVSKTKLIASAGVALGGAGDSLPPVQELHPPSAGAAPRTVIESSIGTVTESSLTPAAEKPEKAEKVQLDYSVWPQQPDKQILKDWIAMRKAKRGSFSQTVIDGFGEEFRKAIPFGYSVNDCLKAAIMSNWTGFKFNWLQNQNARGSQNGTQAKPSLIDRFIQNNYAGPSFENDHGPMGSDDSFVRGEVVQPVRGDTRRIGPMETDIIGDFKTTGGGCIG